VVLVCVKVLVSEVVVSIVVCVENVSVAELVCVVVKSVSVLAVMVLIMVVLCAVELVVMEGVCVVVVPEVLKVVETLEVRVAVVEKEAETLGVEEETTLALCETPWSLRDWLIALFKVLRSVFASVLLIVVAKSKRDVP
jgi:hypothetical protein